MGLISNLDIARDNDFRNRLRGAIVVTAIAVQEEAANTAMHAERSALAHAVLREQDRWVEIFLMPVVIKGGFNNSPNDNNLQNAVNNVWNVIATGGV